ncbi:MAG TPA: EAL domain-containing protein [Oscillatoriales cyanobacterium M59_W2019_021]|nr:EAL domain-containing protein [Oscillatoriales cyanobacterium M4454_W2019_049]HIK50881.1 EAL domain-containing protein [Oscillatoriales cyanobacterium M59_W2019_021]
MNQGHKPSKRHVLVVEDSQGRRAILLEPSTYSIGRDESLSIVLHSRLVSRHHATLFGIQDPETQERAFWIVDGDSQGDRSKNGLIVNGQKKLSHELGHGDLILFGGGAKASYHIISDSQNATNATDRGKSGLELPRSIERFDTTMNSDTQFVSKPELEQVCDAELVRLASFPELLPHPIVEINLDGQITYLNPAALLKFPNLQVQGLNHPLLVNLLPELQTHQESLLMRSVQIGDRVFEQSIHFITESQLIRSYIFDITERHQAETALRQSEATNRALIHAIPDAMLRIDRDGRLLDFKSPNNFQFPLDFNRWIGSPLTAVLPEEVVQLFRLHLQKALDTGDIQVFEFQLQSNGSLYDYEARYVVIGEREVLSIVRDITARKQAEQTIHYQAFYDGLTGLPNRTLFNQRLEEILADCQQNSRSMGVMFLDIDRFKTINDTLGHANGDRLVHQFGQRLMQCVRALDVVARWGGDEFTVLLPDLGSAKTAQDIAQKVLDALKSPFQLENQELYISSSIGIALYPEHGEDGETLLRHADVALYRAKEQGRQNCQFYLPTMNSDANVWLTLEHCLYQALEREEFSLHYQPQINVRTGEITGMEALLRWYHPHFGLVPPSQFIPLAEETGLIVPIGEWVMRTACAQNQAWHASGFGQLQIAVNLSARQFQHPHLVAEVSQILKETGLDPRFLELEITETTLMQNVEMARTILGDLQNMGICLSLDDFGTGYSSLGYLKQFPFNTLKIDRSFVHDLREESSDTAIVAAVLALGSGLNLRVVAEGVETPQQLSLLQDLQCQQMQGYLFAPPLKALDATKYLLEHSLHSDKQGIRSIRNFCTTTLGE